MDLAAAWRFLEQSELVASADEVQGALRRVAEEIAARLGGDYPLVLAVMGGAVVFAGHGVGGLTGALLTGVLAQKVWNSAGADGLLFGNPGQLATQALGCLSSALYAAAMTFVILKALSLVTALRVVPRTEGVGMDVSQHGEEAYASGEGSILVPPEAAILPEPMPAFTPQVASR